jgi:hypothetical protein
MEIKVELEQLVHVDIVMSRDDAKLFTEECTIKYPSNRGLEILSEIVTAVQFSLKPGKSEEEA